jgi:DNA invertase Pin-like site-specific DNA recombinase
MSKTYGYLRISTVLQDLDKNKLAIFEFCDQKNLGKIKFIEETISGTVSFKKRKLGELVETLKKDDVLVTSEISRLGRSISDIHEIIKVLRQKGVKTYTIKEGLDLSDNSLQTTIMFNTFALCAQIESDLLSQRTKEALQVKKASGVKLGRKKGFTFSKLDKYDKLILKMVENGSSQKHIATKLKVTEKTLGTWLKKHEKNKASAK